MFIGSIFGNEILIFMDNYARYNHIFIIEDDVSKTYLKYPSSLRKYEQLVTPFSLKSSGVTNQKAINLILNDMINHNIEVYINDIKVKSKSKAIIQVDYILSLNS